MTTPAAARTLTTLDGLLALGEQRQGALWRLAEPGRGLDANVVRLGPGAVVGEHSDDVLDVLLVVLDGEGQLVTPEGRQELVRHTVVWLPRTSRRSLEAGAQGLVYLTAHRRRPGMAIAGAVTDTGGEAACLLDRVCPECGRLAPERDARFCGNCGQALSR
ncbi:zinc ribbon domain-containing protein [Streptomyces sp. NBC_01465]|uniref:zinc ribbon domain-containing protein n=1 Tax=Streptomyces sp. NBC_01465 TaxID=2903878 RepID=UPI002E361DE1|nr:zinc ribbon domain-containing protein [Streptomyces sp. NBC_01465]